MAPPGQLDFNFIYIAQSFTPDELPAGSYVERVEKRPGVEGTRLAGFDLGAEVIDIATKDELFAFLQRVRAEVETMGRSPILHLEIHGSADHKGLMLSSSEFVSWTSLLEPLGEINSATGNKLLLSLAVPHRAWIETIVSASRPAPFWALIGPSTSEHSFVLFPAFEAFYRTLLDERDSGKAVAEVLETANAKSAKHSLAVLLGERVFQRAFRQYVEEECNPDAIARRAAEIVAKGKQQASARGSTVQDAHWRRLAADISAGLGDTRRVFEEYRQRFFMIDLWPENNERFALTYDDVVAGA